MKRAILIICVMLAAHVLYAQKRLSELRVTLDSTEFEEVHASSLDSIMYDQKQKGERFKRFYDIRRLRSNDTNKIFRLKETGEFIEINSRLNKEYKENWDKVVAMNIAMFASEEYGRKSYVEYLSGETYRAVIFFRKKNTYGISNGILYKNREKDAFLRIEYISDQPDEVKVENLRKIVKGLRID